jgi:hypothetical protein
MMFGFEGESISEGWLLSMKSPPSAGTTQGGTPSELPVELPLKYDLIVNMKTAKALGLTIPPSVLVRAERVIDQ